MLKILLVLLPLAASAACSYSDPSSCTKCAASIGMQFDSSTPCTYKRRKIIWIFGSFNCVSNRIVFFFSGNCNDNAGTYGEMCPKTGAPAYPKCCSVDGTAATLQSCKCGTTSCSAGQMCTAATNTCAYPVCAKIDGSAASTSETECQCGTTSCSSKSTSSWW